MTERDPLPNAEGKPTASTASQPSQAGIYDAPANAPAENRRLVGMYDRPERTGPSPAVLIAAAIVIILLVIALAFLFLR